jgi:hypothetical protein
MSFFHLIFFCGHLTLGIGNIDPNIATDKPAAAPSATIARHFLKNFIMKRVMLLGEKLSELLTERQHKSTFG